jgi:hypothetical protein
MVALCSFDGDDLIYMHQQLSTTFGTRDYDATSQVIEITFS